MMLPYPVESQALNLYAKDALLKIQRQHVRHIVVFSVCVNLICVDNIIHVTYFTSKAETSTITKTTSFIGTPLHKNVVASASILSDITVRKRGRPANITKTTRNLLMVYLLCLFSIYEYIT